MKKTFNFLALLSVMCSSAHAAISISTNNSGGSGRVITTSTGVALTGGSIRMGYFTASDLADKDAVLRGSDWTALNALFIPLGESASNPSRGDVTAPVGVAGDRPIPVGATTAGRYTGTVSGITNTGVATGTRLFLLASNSADPANTAPSEWALVGAVGAGPTFTPIWAAPFDDPNTGGSTALALNNTNIADANDVYRGDFSTAGFLRLAAVPEPSISALFLLGAAVGLRRRR